MRLYLFVATTLVLLCATVGGAIATGEPMADAGLDQTVTDGTSVELDGSGSLHPSGRIASYEWSIETEERRTFEPDCSNCERTEFVPPGPGTYNVTLTVTDNTGQSETDSMSLTVTPGGPTVELSGGSEIQPYRPVTLVSEIDSPDAELDRIGWALDGTLLVERSLNGSTDRSELRISFDAEKAYRIQVVAIDTDGRSTYEERILRIGDATHSIHNEDRQLISLPQPDFRGANGPNGPITHRDTKSDIPARNNSGGFSEYGIRRRNRPPDANRGEYDPSVRSDITIVPHREHRRALGAGRDTFRPRNRSIDQGESTTVDTSTSVVEAGVGSDTETALPSGTTGSSADYTSPAASILRGRSPNATDDP